MVSLVDPSKLNILSKLGLRDACDHMDRLPALVDHRCSSIAREHSRRFHEQGETVAASRRAFAGGSAQTRQGMRTLIKNFFQVAPML
jgi:hypothetical protein